MKNSYVALLRAVNVGGRNKVPMKELRVYLEDLGAENVQTYIASGNVIFTSSRSAAELTTEIAHTLPLKFALDTDLARVLVLTHDQLRTIVHEAPKGFGREPDRYHSDAIFLMGIPANQAIEIFKPREGVDRIWPGDLVVYSQRLSAERTKSRLSAIISSPLYQGLTIRSWATTLHLLDLLDAMERVPDRAEIVTAVLKRDDQVLLCHRSPERQWLPDVWDLPGGHVEPGERASEALVRELREELEIGIDEPRRAPNAVLTTTGFRMQIWLIESWDGVPVNAAPDEHDALAWVTLADVAALDLPHGDYPGLLTEMLNDPTPRNR